MALRDAVCGSEGRGCGVEGGGPVVCCCFGGRGQESPPPPPVPQKLRAASTGPIAHPCEGSSRGDMGWPGKVEVLRSLVHPPPPPSHGWGTAVYASDGRVCRAPAPAHGPLTPCRLGDQGGLGRGGHGPCWRGGDGACTAHGLGHTSWGRGISSGSRFWRAHGTGYIGLAATTWVPLGAQVPVLSPNHHPNPSQGRQKGFGKRRIRGGGTGKSSHAETVGVRSPHGKAPITWRFGRPFWRAKLAPSLTDSLHRVLWQELKLWRDAARGPSAPSVRCVVPRKQCPMHCTPAAFVYQFLTLLKNAGDPFATEVSSTAFGA